jgi:hypothetical protein
LLFSTIAELDCSSSQTSFQLILLFNWYDRASLLASIFALVCHREHCSCIQIPSCLLSPLLCRQHHIIRLQVHPVTMPSLTLYKCKWSKQFKRGATCTNQQSICGSNDSNNPIQT